MLFGVAVRAGRAVPGPAGCRTPERGV